jgi:hypothetical protein
MRFRRPQTVALSVLAVATVVTMSCAEPSQPTRPVATAQHLHVSSHHASTITPDLGRLLAALRQATEKYHDFAAAQAAGYTVQVTGCMADPTRGGMGYHYAKGELIDAEAVEAQPEVLLYEPRGEGRFRLVGVEFIVPFTEWTSAEPPMLYGQTFARNETFQVWALHVWVWRHNPRGLFADWNPAVDCSRDDA